METSVEEKRERKGLFSIHNLTTIPGLGQGQYGPSIILDGDIVKAIVESETRRSENGKLTDMLKDNLVRSLGCSSEDSVRIDFHHDSWLLSGMMLDGMECRCFSINDNTRSAIDSRSYNDIRYNSHNIDSSHQSAVIVSTWLLWFNTIISIDENFKQPFCM